MRIPHNLVFTICEAAIWVGQGEIKIQSYCKRSIVALLIMALMFIPGAYGDGVSMEGGTSIEASGSAQGYSVADDSGAISEMSSDGLVESFESALGISPLASQVEKSLKKPAEPQTVLENMQKHTSKW